MLSKAVKERISSRKWRRSFRFVHSSPIITTVTDMGKLGETDWRVEHHNSVNLMVFSKFPKSGHAELTETRVFRGRKRVPYKKE